MSVTKRNKLTPTQIKSSYKRVFNSTDGKIVLEDLENKYLHRAMYSPGMDGLETAYRAGSRDLIVDHIGRKVGVPAEKIIVTQDEED